MNNVQIIGNLARQPEGRNTQSGLRMARTTVAVNRPSTKEGSHEAEADFISVVAFGKTAELLEKYCQKGSKIGIAGRIQTGSYEKDGHKIYTTDVVINRLEFLSRRDSGNNSDGTSATAAPAADTSNDDIDMAFDAEDIPF